MAQAVAGAANRSMIHLLHWRAPDAWAPGIHVRAHWGLLCPAGAALRYRDAAAGMGGGISPKWVADRQPSSGSGTQHSRRCAVAGPLTELSP